MNKSIDYFFSYFILKFIKLIALILIVITLQIKSGCFRVEFGDDEGSHYISGLMIHDYLLSNFRLNPINYLKFYHAHYPLVGIGHWGPAFYLVEGLWMLLFSASRISVLLLSTAISAATAILTYRYAFTRMRLGRSASLFAAVGLIICPIIQEGSSAVMLDLPITLCTLLAILVYVRYIETEKLGYSILFGSLAATAMLIKGNGALLAFVPPLSVALSGKWRLFRKLSFWAPVAIILLSAGPWYYLTYGEVAAGFRYHWGWDYTRVALSENARILLWSMGPLALLLSGAGAAAAVVRSQPGEMGARGIVALVLAVWIFQVTVPAAIQDRYLAPLLPPMYLLAASGGQILVDLIRSRLKVRVVSPLVFGVIVLTLLPAALEVAPKPYLGYREITRAVWEHRVNNNPVVLIATNEIGEASAIAELAMADPARPSLFAVRGSRLLGGGGYNRADYVPKFSSAAQVAAEIDARHIPLVIEQASPGGWSHVTQVEAARRAAKIPWLMIAATFPPAGRVSLYSLPEADGVAADVGAWLKTSGPRSLEK